MRNNTYGSDWQYMYRDYLNGKCKIENVNQSTDLNDQEGN